MAGDPKEETSARGNYGDADPAPSGGESPWRDGDGPLKTDPDPAPVLATEPDATLDLEGTAELDLGQRSAPIDPMSLPRELGETLRDEDPPRSATLARRDFFDAPTEVGQAGAIAPAALPPEQRATLRDDAPPAGEASSPMIHDQPTQLREDPLPEPRRRTPFYEQPTQLKVEESLHEEATDLEVVVPQAPARQAPVDARRRPEPAATPISGTVTVEPLPAARPRRGRLLLYGVGGALLVSIVALGLVAALRSKPEPLVPGTEIDHGRWQLLLYGADVLGAKEGAPGGELRLRLRLRRAGRVVRPEQVRLLLVTGKQHKQPFLLEEVAKSLGDDDSGSIWRVGWRLPGIDFSAARFRFAPEGEEPLLLELTQFRRR